GGTGGRRRQRRGELQPGRDLLQRGQVRRSARPVRGGDEDRPEQRDGAVSARDGIAQPWQDSRGRGRPRGVSEDRSQRPEGGGSEIVAAGAATDAEKVELKTQDSKLKKGRDHHRFLPFSF